MTPLVVSRPRRLSPRAAVMVGLAGIMTALAVLTAAHSSAVPAVRAPAVHSMAPSDTPGLDQVR